MAWTKEQGTNYKNDFNAKTYDRINLTVPKGKKDLYQKRAKQQGLSLNGYINKLLELDTKIDTAQ